MKSGWADDDLDIQSPPLAAPSTTAPAAQPKPPAFQPPPASTGFNFGGAAPQQNSSDPFASLNLNPGGSSQQPPAPFNVGGGASGFGGMGGPAQ